MIFTFATSFVSPLFKNWWFVFLLYDPKTAITSLTLAFFAKSVQLYFTLYMQLCLATLQLSTLVCILPFSCISLSIIKYSHKYNFVREEPAAVHKN